MKLKALLGVAFVSTLVGFTSVAVAQPAVHSTTSVDREFVQHATKANDDELASAQSERNRSDPSVRMYAQTIVRDHGHAAAQLEALAKQFNISYPSPAPAPVALSPHQYMSGQVTAHKQAISLYENEVKHGSNPHLRTYAAHTLPTLKKHLAMAEQYLSTGHITSE